MSRLNGLSPPRPACRTPLWSLIGLPSSARRVPAVHFSSFGRLVISENLINLFSPCRDSGSYSVCCIERYQTNKDYLSNKVNHIHALEALKLILCENTLNVRALDHFRHCCATLKFFLVLVSAFALCSPSDTACVRTTPEKAAALRSAWGEMAAAYFTYLNARQRYRNAKTGALQTGTFPGQQSGHKAHPSWLASWCVESYSPDFQTITLKTDCGWNHLGEGDDPPDAMTSRLDLLPPI